MSFHYLSKTILALACCVVGISAFAAAPDMRNDKQAAIVLRMLSSDLAQSDLVARGIPTDEARKLKAAADTLDAALRTVRVAHAEKVCADADKFLSDPQLTAAEVERYLAEVAATRRKVLREFQEAAPVAWSAAEVDASNNIELTPGPTEEPPGDAIRAGRISTSVVVTAACKTSKSSQDGSHETDAKP
jgi:hypothetical protein